MTRAAARTSRSSSATRPCPTPLMRRRRAGAQRLTRRSPGAGHWSASARGALDAGEWRRRPGRRRRLPCSLQVVRRDDAALAAGEIAPQGVLGRRPPGRLRAPVAGAGEGAARKRYSQVLRDALPAHLAKDALDDAAADVAVPRAARGRAGRPRRRRGPGRGRGHAPAHRHPGRRQGPARPCPHPHPRRPAADRPVLGGAAARAAAPGPVGRYMAELAEAIDARMQRLGQHAAETAPLWATRTLRPGAGRPGRPGGLAEARRGRGRLTGRCAATTIPATRSVPSRRRRPRRPGRTGTTRSPRSAAWTAWTCSASADEVLRGPPRAVRARDGLGAGACRRAAAPGAHDHRRRAGARGPGSEHEERAAATAEARSQHAENKAIWAAMKAKAYEELSAYEKADLARRGVGTGHRGDAPGGAGRRPGAPAPPPGAGPRAAALRRAAEHPGTGPRHAEIRSPQEQLPGMPQAAQCEPETTDEAAGGRADARRPRPHPETAQTRLPGARAAGGRERPGDGGDSGPAPHYARARRRRRRDLSPGEAWAVLAGRRRDCGPAARRDAWSLPRRRSTQPQASAEPEADVMAALWAPPLTLQMWTMEGIVRTDDEIRRVLGWPGQESPATGSARSCIPRILRGRGATPGGRTTHGFGASATSWNGCSARRSLRAAARHSQQRRPTPYDVFADLTT